jgi:hypothetical protein
MLPEGCGVALRDLGVDAPELGSRTVSRNRVPLLVGGFVLGRVWAGTSTFGGCGKGCSRSTTSTVEEADGLLYSPDCPTLLDIVS